MCTLNCMHETVAQNFIEFSCIHLTVPTTNPCGTHDPPCTSAWITRYCGPPVQSISSVESTTLFFFSRRRFLFSAWLTCTDDVIDASCAWVTSGNLSVESLKETKITWCTIVVNVCWLAKQPYSFSPFIQFYLILYTAQVDLVIEATHFTDEVDIGSIPVWRISASESAVCV